MPASNRLNAMQVTKIKQPGRYADGGGLYLRVAEYETRLGRARSKNWVFRFERDGRERFMGLGSLNTLSLAEARERARECRRLILDGGDPIDTRRKRKLEALAETAKIVTFRLCAERYIAAHRKGWKNPVHAGQWPSTLAAYVYPVIGTIPVGSVDTGLVVKCLAPIWERIPDTAARVRGRIEKVLDFAKAHGHRDGENPARWRGHLKNVLRSSARRSV